MLKMIYLLYIVWHTLAISSAANSQLIFLSRSLTSRLDSTFNRNASEPFSFTNFTHAQTASCPAAESHRAELFAARHASFVSYSSEFTALIGLKSKLRLLERRPVSCQFAHEGGTFVPETNEIWFSANQEPTQNTNVSSVDLSSNRVRLLSIQSPIITPNGVNYFNGLVYICSKGNMTTSGAIYAVNPTTLKSKLVVNSWYGLRLNSPNDVTFSTKIGGRKYMWFTDPHGGYLQGFSSPPQLGSYVYRLDLITSELRPVITDLAYPNGIAFDQSETTLYVSDTSPKPLGAGAFAVYAYDLTNDALLVNRRVFSVSSLGVPDGIRVDRRGRVWTGEGDGINVRDRHGTLLGVILARDLSKSGVISNFALKDKTLIILAQEKLWRLELTVSVL